ncbi:MAG: isoaspartyl peptidase/L-asparaginase [Alphaproteobacteria bacterium]|nr:isoaspartyl peptidase/L-asparaginase [Alphaproteobacteria bacterium]
MPTPRLVIHGGCGAIPKADMTAARAESFRSSLRASLAAGWAVLAKGGAAMDAVTAAIVVMEDDPNFNAGHGSAFNEDGAHELDASIMDGATLLAGSIAAARCIRNPITVVAELAKRNADPLMLAGPGADDWARANGFAMVDNSYFSTQWRRDALEQIRARDKAGTLAAAPESEKHGTVGAVALDAAGHLAAGTSTGGYTGKRVGRVGDSPIIGAGTWADDRTCAISATGKGEFFIRKVLAHEIHARIRWAGRTLAQACEEMIHGELDGWAAGAGLVAIDRDGHFVLPFNTEGMYRGHAGADGLVVDIYR